MSEKAHGRAPKEGGRVSRSPTFWNQGWAFCPDDNVDLSTHPACKVLTVVLRPLCGFSFRKTPPPLAEPPKDLKAGI